jgi:uncharacterized membrane protein YcgQ (UPF0703/DUF1980 family)
VLKMDSGQFLGCIDTVSRPRLLCGTPIEVTAFVFRDLRRGGKRVRGRPDDMTCCEYEMEPLGIQFRYDKASQYLAGQWVRVRNE